MPQFLTTIKTSAAIEDIIKKAKKRIVLISPYLKLTKQLYLRLNDAAQKGIPITVVYGKSELRNEEQEQILALKGIKLLFLQDLHAKCYFNEQELIVTSMNMYEFSEKNNYEMGVLFSASADKEIYDEVILEAALFVKNADQKNQKENKKELAPVKTKVESKTGYNKSSFVRTEYTKSTKKSVEENSLLVITKNYQKLSNFHFHSLYSVLSAEYPSNSKSLNQIDYGSGILISVNDFPFRGVHLIISDSIKFLFDNKYEFEQIKHRVKDTFESRVPSANFYWNYFDLNIVPAPENTFVVSQDGLRSKVAHYLEIIRLTSNAFKKSE